MKIDLSALYKKHTNEDGTVDFDKAQEEFQNQWNGYEAKQKPIYEQRIEEAKKGGVNEFVAGLGIENVTSIDSFKSYTDTLKTSATDKDNAIAELTEKYKDYDSVKEALNKAQGDIFSNDVKSEISKVFGGDYVEDVFELIHNKIDEENPKEALVKTYAENPKYGSWLKQTEQKVFVKKGQSNKTEETKVKNPFAKFY